MAKRRIFDEMMEGIAAMKNHREGKLTLRTYKVEPAKGFKAGCPTQAGFACVGLLTFTDN